MSKSSFNEFLRRIYHSRRKALKSAISYDSHVCYEPNQNYYAIHDIGYKLIANGRGSKSRVNVKKIKDRGGQALYEIDKTFLFLGYGL
jgi:hypothetical protein